MDDLGQLFNESMAVHAGEKCVCDQPCKFGYRVGTHAVYCHNHKWEDAPRKCRRTWYTRGKTRDEDCLGYIPNELKEVLNG